MRSTSNEYGPSDSSIGFYNPWCPQGYYMGGFEVMYNEFGYNGRTGIIWNQGQPTTLPVALATSAGASITTTSTTAASP